MTDEQRGVRLDQFMVAVKWMLGLLGVMAVLAFVVTVGAISDSRKQTVDTIEALKKQVEVLRDQNMWSQQDRANIHEILGQVKEAAKRTEAKVK